MLQRPRKARLTRPLAAVLTAAAVFAPSAAASPPASDARAVSPAASNPLTGLPLFVDREKHESWMQLRAYLRRGEGSKAALMQKIATQPKFQWLGRWTDDPRGGVRRLIERSGGATPLITVMRHQGKECRAGYTAGGAAEDARHRHWIDRLAHGIGGSRVVIAYEPDSLGTMECLAPHRRRARLDNLRYGVNVLSKLPNATIYLEGGASDWEPPAKTARKLRYIGIHKVRGFMLNVTHYDWTLNNIRYGLKVSRRVGGTPFIINTAYNGRGPVHYRQRIGGRRRRINVWCHPLKRGLGIPPTTSTHHPKVDAYMWIGRPGFSSGGCNGGPSKAGAWWEERALMFARYATDWIRPPRGTRFGHSERYSLRQLGAPR